MSIIAWGLIIIGGLFYGLGGLGVYRMPDVYNRAQAGTKATTLGTLSLILGLMILHPEWIAKLFLIMIFIIVTNPIGSSTLIRNAFVKGVKPVEGTQMEDFTLPSRKETNE